MSPISTAMELDFGQPNIWLHYIYQAAYKLLKDKALVRELIFKTGVPSAFLQSSGTNYFLAFRNSLF